MATGVLPIVGIAEGGGTPVRLSPFGSLGIVEGVEFCEHRHMQFDGRPVLREAYLKLRSGDRVGLIGKNGAGKTTFLELVLGRREPWAAPST